MTLWLILASAGSGRVLSYLGSVWSWPILGRQAARLTADPSVRFGCCQACLAALTCLYL